MMLVLGLESNFNLVDWIALEAVLRSSKLFCLHPFGFHRLFYGQKAGICRDGPFAPAFIELIMLSHMTEPRGG